MHRRSPLGHGCCTTYRHYRSAQIRRIRVAKGLTQCEVAKGAEVTKNYITMLEIGARQNCSLPVLRRIAKALGVPVAKLLE